jgi:hypothetical protein
MAAASLGFDLAVNIRLHLSVSSLLDTQESVFCITGTAHRSSLISSLSPSFLFFSLSPLLLSPFC